MINFKGKYSVAIGFLNRWTSGTPIRVSFALSELGLNHPSGYSAIDIFSGKPLGNFSPKSTFTADVNPSGIYLKLSNKKLPDLIIIYVFSKLTIKNHFNDRFIYVMEKYRNMYCKL